MFIRTARLLLRPPWPCDAPALHAAIADERIVRNLARAPWPYLASHAEEFCRRPPESVPSFLAFARTDGPPELIGGIGLGRRDRGMELGYWFAVRAWGLGYATEAGRAVLTMARHSLRLERIESGHFLDNPASGRVLEKLGFAPTVQTGLHPSLARGELVPFQPFILELQSASAGERLAA